MKNKNGFTLIEIIVTVCLIAIMMALTVPGLMNYFTNVDEDRYKAETESIVAQFNASANQISLAGSDGERTLSVEEANKIVKKAQGSGEIKYQSDIVFADGKITHLLYHLSGGQSVLYTYINGKENYVMSNSEDDKIFETPL